ncbi:MAG: hypothetical protein LBU11_05210 [Zoogloeaceae bacterium]|nr:hypothetical protein [Zoogloeaceae bacterium]
MAFISSLTENMDAIEKMRNAVAHNRRPSKEVKGNYEKAYGRANQSLDDYLESLAEENADDA